MINKIKKLDYSKILLIFLYIQPILDIIYGLSFYYLKIDVSINTIIRFIFMLIAFFYLIFINKDKKSLIATLLIAVYLALFGIYTIIAKDHLILFYEIKNMVSYFFFPVILLFFISIKDKINIEDKHYFYLNLIYLFFIIFPNLIGLGFRSYAEAKGGYTGWFYSSNAIGNIITIIIPITIYYLFNSKKKWLLIFYIMVIFAIFFSIGTKAPILGFIMILLLLMIWGIVKLFIAKKYIHIGIIFIALILAAGSLYYLTPKTTFYKNLKIHMDYFKIDNKNLLTNEKFWQQIVFSRRMMFLETTKKNFQNSTWKTKLIGIGFVENYKQDSENLKTIEVDYYDVYYRSGILGTITYIIGVIIAMIDVFKKKIVINFNNYCIFISLFLCVLLAFFCGHVYTSPATAIIVCYIMTKLDKKLV